MHANTINGNFLLSDQLPLTQTGVIALAKMNAKLQKGKEEDKRHITSKSINLRQIKHIFVNSTSKTGHTKMRKDTKRHDT